MSKRLLRMTPSDPHTYKIIQNYNQYSDIFGSIRLIKFSILIVLYWFLTNLATKVGKKFRFWTFSLVYGSCQSFFWKIFLNRFKIGCAQFWKPKKSHYSTHFNRATNQFLHIKTSLIISKRNIHSKPIINSIAFLNAQRRRQGFQVLVGNGLSKLSMKSTN